MSFGRSKRFEDIVSCVPPPGYYNPIYKDKVNTPILVNNEDRFKEPKVDCMGSFSLTPKKFGSSSACTSMESLHGVPGEKSFIPRKIFKIVPPSDFARMRKKSKNHNVCTSEMCYERIKYLENRVKQLDSSTSSIQDNSVYYFCQNCLTQNKNLEEKINVNDVSNLVDQKHIIPRFQDDMKLYFKKICDKFILFLKKDTSDNDYSNYKNIDQQNIIADKKEESVNENSICLEGNSINLNNSINGYIDQSDLEITCENYNPYFMRKENKFKNVEENLNDCTMRKYDNSVYNDKNNVETDLQTIPGISTNDHEDNNGLSEYHNQHNYIVSMPKTLDNIFKFLEWKFFRSQAMEHIRIAFEEIETGLEEKESKMVELIEELKELKCREDQKDYNIVEIKEKFNEEVANRELKHSEELLSIKEEIIQQENLIKKLTEFNEKYIEDLSLKDHQHVEEIHKLKEVINNLNREIQKLNNDIIETKLDSDHKIENLQDLKNNFEEKIEAFSNDISISNELIKKQENIIIEMKETFKINLEQKVEELNKIIEDKNQEINQLVENLDLISSKLNAMEVSAIALDNDRILKEKENYNLLNIQDHLEQDKKELLMKLNNLDSLILMKVHEIECKEQFITEQNEKLEKSLDALTYLESELKMVKENNSSEINAKNVQINELNITINKLNESFSQLQVIDCENKRRIYTFESEISSKELCLKIMEDKFKVAEEEISKLNNEWSGRLTDVVSQYESEKNENCNKIKVILEEKNEILSKFKNLEINMNELERNNLEFQQKYNELKQELTLKIQNLNDDLNEAILKNDSATNEIINLNKDIGKKEEQIIKIEKSNCDLLTELNDQVVTASIEKELTLELQKKVYDMNEEIKQTNILLKGSETTVDNLLSDKFELLNQLKINASSLDTINKEITEMKEINARQLKVLNDQIEEVISEKEMVIINSKFLEESMAKERKSFEESEKNLKEKLCAMDENLLVLNDQNSKLISEVKNLKNLEIMVLNLEDKIKELNTKNNQVIIELTNKENLITNLESKNQILAKSLQVAEKNIANHELESKKKEEIMEKIKILELEVTTTISNDYETKLCTMEEKINSQSLKFNSLKNKIIEQKEFFDKHKNLFIEHQKRYLEAIANIKNKDEKIQELYGKLNLEGDLKLKITESVNREKRLKEEILDLKVKLKGHEMVMAKYNEGNETNLKLSQEKFKVERNLEDAINEMKDLKKKLTEMVEKLSIKEEICSNNNKIIEDFKLQLNKKNEEIVALKEEIMSINLQSYQDLKIECDEWRTKYEELWQRVQPFNEQLERFQLEKMALLGQNEDARKQTEKLFDDYAKILGHQNSKQKIHHVVMLKDDNCKLRKELETARLKEIANKSKIKSLTEKLDAMEGRKHFETTKIFRTQRDKENVPDALNPRPGSSRSHK